MNSQTRSTLLLCVIYLGFISLGLPDGTFGVAWPQMYRELGAPIGIAGTFLIVGTLLAALSGFSSGWVLKRLKVGPVVLVSCLLTGTGLLLLGQSQNLWWLYATAIPLGLGAGSVDAGLNGFVARHYSGRHMNWLHACWGVGATCGPLVMAEALTWPSGWRGGYTTLGTIQLGLAVVFLLTLGLWKKVPERRIHENDTHAPSVPPQATANSAAGWLAVTSFIVYVGTETMTGLWTSSILVVSRGIPKETAGLCTAAFYAAITGGRIAVGWMVDRYGNRRLITGGMVLASVGAVLLVIAHTAPVAGAATVLMGLGFAPIYPCLMHEVPRRFAPDSVQTVIGRQSGAGNLGGALIPSLAGWVAQYSLETVAWGGLAGLALLALIVTRLNRLT